MRIGIDNVLGAVPEAVSLRARRTELLANNIANADTPGFKARDLDFSRVLQSQLSQTGRNLPGQKAGPALAATHAAHLRPGGGDSSATEVLYRVPLMPSLDGNSVDTQMEQAEFAENNVQFLAGLRILNGRLQGMMSAIKGE